MNNTSDTPRPMLRDYFDKWSIVAVSPHEQERSAREDFAMADRAWLSARNAELKKVLKEAREEIGVIDPDFSIWDRIDAALAAEQTAQGERDE